jgi:branched-chain amino acid transport system substrate-binding protein
MKKLVYLNILFIILLLACNNVLNNNTKIGVLFPMTGDTSEYGVKGKKAIELAVEQINHSGGINGKNIEAVFEDSKADPATGVTAIQKLISVDRVSAVVGDIVSAVTIPAAAVAEKNKVVMIAPTSSAPAITLAGAFIYRVWPSDLLEGSAAGNYAKQKGFKRAVVLHLNNDYGNQIAEIFTKNFQTDSQAVVSNEAYDSKAKDFRAILTKVKDKKPDTIYIAGYYEDTASLLKQAKELNINVKFIGATAIEDMKFLELAGRNAEGIVYPLASGFDAASQDPSAKQFVEAFKTKYNEVPSWVESHCYDAFMLIVTAMKTTSNKTVLKDIDKDFSILVFYKKIIDSIKYTNKTDSENIRNYLDTMNTYNGVTGSIKFDMNGDISKPVIFKTVRNGQFVPL